MKERIFRATGSNSEAGIWLPVKAERVNLPVLGSRTLVKGLKIVNF